MPRRLAYGSVSQSTTAAVSAQGNGHCRFVLKGKQDGHPAKRPDGLRTWSRVLMLGSAVTLSLVTRQPPWAACLAHPVPSCPERPCQALLTGGRLQLQMHDVSAAAQRPSTKEQSATRIALVKPYFMLLLQLLM